MPIGLTFNTWWFTRRFAMAVTYSDLVAFGFAYVENSTLINVKQQKLFNACSCVPALSPSGPCLCSEEDFIIFGEFSEVKGPMPLLTLPYHIQENHIDLVNTFIMRIMSVDYHASTGSQFRVCEDTQVLETYITSDKHAYVHYLTLYDVQARGFVRPLCIAYVSSDERKLHHIFPELRDHFNKITQVLKANSWQLFMRELTSIMKSLRDIQTQLREISQREDNGEIITDVEKKEVEKLQGYQVVHQLAEYSDMVAAVEKELNSQPWVLETLEEWKRALKRKTDGRAVEEVLSYMKTCAVNGDDVGTLRPLPAISPWGSACALWLMNDVLKRYHPCLLNTSLGGFPLLLDYDSPLERKETSKSTESADDALNQSEFLILLSKLSKSSWDLASLEDSLKVHRQHFLPQFESGNEVTSKSHPALRFEEEIQDADWPIKSTYISNQDGGTYFKAEMYSSRVSVYSRDEEETDPSDDVVCTRETCGQIYSYTVNANGEEEKDNESFQDIMQSFHSEDSWSVSSTDVTPSEEGRESIQDVMDIQRQCEGVWSQCLWTRFRPRNKPGHRLLRFFWTYCSSAQHIIYALLMGRTVILAGDSLSEKKVFRMITALIPIIPQAGQNPIRVLRWHKGIIVAPYIARYQVIGLCVPERLCVHDMISAKDKNLVTILDINDGQLSGPAYQGKLLASLGPTAVDYPSDHSLLLLVQSVLANISCRLSTFNSLRATHSKMSANICRMLELYGCDADIIQYLSKISQ